MADAFLAPARRICRDPDDGYELTLAVVTAAHGHAALLLDGAFGKGRAGVDAARRRTANVTRAIIYGRHQLRQPDGR